MNSAHIMLALCVFWLAGAAPADDTPQANTCTNWHAHYDLQPPGPHKLHLSADCTFPTSGYHVVLKPGKKGTDPDTRVLQKVAHKPEGMVMQVITTIPLAYTEQTDHSYKKVRILPDGPTLDVEEVH